ncbi:MAG: NADH-quinone oxidoreductase subunit NuoK [Candidatus Omnitrophica bacterium]|nr:NADH-quinone oxidoreductase subunit NuoK [Candidatus Omnitrophota bacterium]
MITLQHYLVLSGLLFAIGLAGILTRRNILFLLLSIELMFNAANLLFVAYARMWQDVGGQVMVLFIITVAAAEVTVGLAIAILMSRQLRSLNADEAHALKW